MPTVQSSTSHSNTGSGKNKFARADSNVKQQAAKQETNAGESVAAETTSEATTNAAAAAAAASAQQAAGGNKTPQEQPEFIKQALVIIEKKVRNLEKRRVSDLQTTQQFSS